MKCSEARDRMVFFVDGEDAEVGAHVRGCAACRTAADQVAREKAVLSRAIAEEVSATPVRMVSRRAVARPALSARWPFIAAAAAVFAALIYFLSRGPEEPAPEKSTATKPVPQIKRSPDETPVPPREEPARDSDRKKDETAPKEKPREETPREEKPIVREEEAKKTHPEEKPPEKKEEKKEDKKAEDTTPARETVEITLALESGTAKNLKWKGPKIFKSGESIQAQTGLRIACPEDATLYLKEGTVVSIGGKREIALTAGALLVENAGPEFTIVAGAAKIKDLGTRFSVSVEGKRIETVVYEGRVSSETTLGRCQAEAGQRISVSESAAGVSDIKGVNSYPAWMARIAPRYQPVVTLNTQRQERAKLCGSLKDGELHAVERGEELVLGVDNDASEPWFAVPARGEFWVTYTTNSPKPITLRCRALRPETKAFDYVLKNPIVGRPTPVHVPLSLFKSVDAQFLNEKDRVHIVYIFTADRTTKLSISELSIVDRRE